MGPAPLNQKKSIGDILSAKDLSMMTLQQMANEANSGQDKSLAASIVQIMHKNMMIDPGDLNKKRVKKDVLWKPLLRGFRSYYRSQLSHSLNL
mmetsp:Transcript_4195/g.5592  ORF Transcript_4195/g.5592 Transcript_4195/m.5592 type:complete len:93 (-) Transcript_4195:628-906(-)